MFRNSKYNNLSIEELYEKLENPYINQYDKKLIDKKIKELITICDLENYGIKINIIKNKPFGNIANAFDMINI